MSPGARGAQESGVSPEALAAGDAYLRAMQAAGEAYAQKDFEKALTKLQVADDIHPGIVDTWNMRGAIYAEQHAFDKAEHAFAEAKKASPRDFWPAYNLAELLLTEGKYEPAAKAFETLAVYRGHEELLAFKIVFTELLAGNADAAKPVLDAMKFPCDTPAYYFAHAAWGFAHKDHKDGAYWTRAAMQVFGVEKCVSYYDEMAAVKWVEPRNLKTGAIPDPTHVSPLEQPLAVPGDTP